MILISLIVARYYIIKLNIDDVNKLSVVAVFISVFVSYLDVKMVYKCRQYYENCMETNRAIDIIGMLFLICYEIYDINMPISSMIGCII